MPDPGRKPEDATRSKGSRAAAFLALAAFIIMYFPGHGLSIGDPGVGDADLAVSRAIVARMARSFALGDWSGVTRAPWLAPHTATVFLTDVPMIPAAAAAPIFRFLPTPLHAHDLMVFLGWALSAIAVYVLARRLGLSRAAAWVAVFVAGANPVRTAFQNDFHHWAVFAVASSLALLVEYRRTGHAPLLLAALSLPLVAAHSAGGWFPTGVAALLPFAVWAAADRSRRGLQFWSVVVAAVAIGVVSYGPVVHLTNDALERFYEHPPASRESDRLLWNAFASAPGYWLGAVYDAWPDAWKTNIAGAYPGIAALILGLWALRRPSRDAAQPAALSRDLRIFRAGVLALPVLALPAALAVSEGFWAPFGNMRADEADAFALALVAWPLIARIALCDRSIRFFRSRDDARVPLVVMTVMIVMIAAGAYVSDIRPGPVPLVRARLWNPLGDAFEHVPRLLASHAPARGMVYAFLGLGVLAGMGFDRLRGLGKTPRGRRLIGFAAIVPLFLDMTPVRAFTDWSPAPRNDAGPAACRFLAGLPPGELMVQLPRPDILDGRKDDRSLPEDASAISCAAWHELGLIDGAPTRPTLQSDFFAFRYRPPCHSRSFYRVLSANGIRYAVIREPLPGDERPLIPDPPPPWKEIWREGREAVFENPAPRRIEMGEDVFDRLEVRAFYDCQNMLVLEMYLPESYPPWFMTFESRRLAIRIEVSGKTPLSFEREVFLPASIYRRDVITNLVAPKEIERLTEGVLSVFPRGDNRLMGSWPLPITEHR